LAFKRLDLWGFFPGGCLSPLHVRDSAALQLFRGVALRVNAQNPLHTFSRNFAVDSP